MSLPPNAVLPASTSAPIPPSRVCVVPQAVYSSSLNGCFWCSNEGTHISGNQCLFCSPSKTYVSSKQQCSYINDQVPVTSISPTTISATKVVTCPVSYSLDEKEETCTLRSPCPNGWSSPTDATICYLPCTPPTEDGIQVYGPYDGTCYYYGGSFGTVTQEAPRYLQVIDAKVTYVCPVGYTSTENQECWICPDNTTYQSSSGMCVQCPPNSGTLNLQTGTCTATVPSYVTPSSIPAIASGLNYVTPNGSTTYNTPSPVCPTDLNYSQKTASCLLCNPNSDFNADTEQCTCLPSFVPNKAQSMCILNTSDLPAGFQLASNMPTNTVPSLQYATPGSFAVPESSGETQYIKTCPTNSTLQNNNVCVECPFGAIPNTAVLGLLNLIDPQQLYSSPPSLTALGTDLVTAATVCACDTSKGYLAQEGGFCAPCPPNSSLVANIDGSASGVPAALMPTCSFTDVDCASTTDCPSSFPFCYANQCSTQCPQLPMYCLANYGQTLANSATYTVDVLENSGYQYLGTTVYPTSDVNLTVNITFLAMGYMMVLIVTANNWGTSGITNNTLVVTLDNNFNSNAAVMQFVPIYSSDYVTIQDNGCCQISDGTLTLGLLQPDGTLSNPNGIYLNGFVMSYMLETPISSPPSSPPAMLSQGFGYPTVSFSILSTTTPSVTLTKGPTTPSCPPLVGSVEATMLGQCVILIFPAQPATFSIGPVTGSHSGWYGSPGREYLGTISINITSIVSLVFTGMIPTNLCPSSRLDFYVNIQGAGLSVLSINSSGDVTIVIPNTNGIQWNNSFSVQYLVNSLPNSSSSTDILSGIVSYNFTSNWWSTPPSVPIQVCFSGPLAWLILPSLTNSGTFEGIVSTETPLPVELIPSVSNLGESMPVIVDGSTFAIGNVSVDANGIVSISGVLSGQTSMNYSSPPPTVSNTTTWIQNQFPLLSSFSIPAGNFAIPYVLSQPVNANFQQVTQICPQDYPNCRDHRCFADTGSSVPDYTVQNCFADSTTTRALPLSSEQIATGANLIQTCQQDANAKDSSIYSIQYGNQCFYAPPSLSLAEQQQTAMQYGTSTACTMPCNDGTNNTCGGSYANQLYTTLQNILGESTTPILPYSGAKAKFGTQNSCYGDFMARAIPNENSTGVSSIAECAQIASQAGASVFGVQYGGQCFTADPTLSPLQQLADATQYGSIEYACTMQCSSGQVCGGPWANNVYVITSGVNTSSPEYQSVNSSQCQATVASGNSTIPVQGVCPNAYSACITYGSNENASCMASPKLTATPSMIEVAYHLEAWFDAMNNGSDTSAVVDLSAHGHNASLFAEGVYSSTTTTATPPSWVSKGINNLPSWSFSAANGNSGYCSYLPAGTLSQGFTWFAVVQNLSPLEVQNQESFTFLSRTSGNIPAPWDFYSITPTTQDTTLYRVLIGNGSSFTYNSTATLGCMTSPTIVMMTCTNTGELSLYQNGVNIYSQAASSSIPYGDNSNYLFMGTRQDLQTGFTGMIGEVIVYSTVLSTNDLESVMTYLSQKWTIPVQSLLMPANLDTIALVAGSNLCVCTGGYTNQKGECVSSTPPPSSPPDITPITNAMINTTVAAINCPTYPTFTQYPSPGGDGRCYLKQPPAGIPTAPGGGGYIPIASGRIGKNCKDWGTIPDAFSIYNSVTPTLDLCTFMRPSAIGGTCPSGTHQYGDESYCLDDPPPYNGSVTNWFATGVSGTCRLVQSNTACTGSQELVVHGVCPSNGQGNAMDANTTCTANCTFAPNVEGLARPELITVGDHCTDWNTVTWGDCKISCSQTRTCGWTSPDGCPSDYPKQFVNTCYPSNINDVCPSGYFRSTGAALLCTEGCGQNYNMDTAGICYGYLSTQCAEKHPFTCPPANPDYKNLTHAVSPHDGTAANCYGTVMPSPWSCPDNICSLNRNGPNGSPIYVSTYNAGKFFPWVSAQGVEYTPNCQASTLITVFFAVEDKGVSSGTSISAKGSSQNSVTAEAGETNQTIYAGTLIVTSEGQNQAHDSPTTPTPCPLPEVVGNQFFCISPINSACTINNVFSSSDSPNYKKSPSSYPQSQLPYSEFTMGNSETPCNFNCLSFDFNFLALNNQVMPCGLPQMVTYGYSSSGAEQQGRSFVYGNWPSSPLNPVGNYIVFQVTYDMSKITTVAQIQDFQKKFIQTPQDYYGWSASGSTSFVQGNPATYGSTSTIVNPFTAYLLNNCNAYRQLCQYFCFQLDTTGQCPLIQNYATGETPALNTQCTRMATQPFCQSLFGGLDPSFNETNQDAMGCPSTGLTAVNIPVLNSTNSQTTTTGGTTQNANVLNCIVNPFSSKCTANDTAATSTSTTTVTTNAPNTVQTQASQLADGNMMNLCLTYPTMLECQCLLRDMNPQYQTALGTLDVDFRGSDRCWYVPCQDPNVYVPHSLVNDTNDCPTVCATILNVLGGSGETNISNVDFLYNCYNSTDKSVSTTT